MMGVPLEPEKLKPGDKPHPRKQKTEKLLQDHLAVGDRAVFLGKDGALSGTQVIHVKQARKFLAGLNELINEEMLEGAEQKLTNAAKPGSKVDVEALKLQQKAAREGHQWLQFEPGRLNIHLVGTPKSFEEIKRGLLDDLVLKEVYQYLKPQPPPRGKRAKSPAELLDEMRGRVGEIERVVDFFALAPLSIDLRKERAIVSIGVGDNEPIRIFSPYMPEKKGRPGPVAEMAKALNLTVLRDATPESVSADFLKKYPPRK